MSERKSSNGDVASDVTCDKAKTETSLVSDALGSYAPETDVVDYLKDVRVFVENSLDSYTRFSTDSPKRLTDAMRYSLLSSGKRLRPTLAVVATELCGGRRQAAVPACVALEATHVYSLIHDDLPAMDDDDLRRGIPTCHKRFDEATAILAGDALLTFAFEALTANIANSLVSSRSVLALAKAAGACGMVGGQADDVLWSAVLKDSPGAVDLIGELTSTTEDPTERASLYNAAVSAFLVKIHRRKTGALIVAALELGALAANASDKQLEVLRAFGRNLGQAFQISDDLLDEVGNEETMGKRVHKDKDSGKLTYVSLFGVEKTKRLLDESVFKAKDALSKEHDLFKSDSLAYKAAMHLVDFTARRDR